MGFPELSRRTALAAMIETVSGTPETPTMATHAIRLLEPPSCEVVYLAENMTDDIVTGRLGVLMMAAPGGRAYRVSGRAAIVGDGVAYSATNLPELDPFFVAAGCTRTITATVNSEKVDYVPNDDPIATMTVIFQENGQQRVIAGAVLEEMNITCDAGGFPVLSFTVVGLASGDPTQQALQPAGYSNTAFPIFKGVNSLTISGVTGLRPKMFGLNLGLSATPRADANATDGHAGYKITGRVPQATVKAEVTALSDYNPEADWHARVSRSMEFVAGSVLGQYKRFKMSLGDTRVMGSTSTDDGGLKYYDVNYRVTMPAAGIEIRYTFD